MSSYNISKVARASYIYVEVEGFSVAHNNFDLEMKFHLEEIKVW